MGDPEAALKKYRARASTYDGDSADSQPARKRLVSNLGLRRGDVVLDVACGTGACFPLIQKTIGPEGHIVGIELSPEMLDVARRRVDSTGWENVTLVNAPVERAEIPVSADAVVFSFTHDVLQSQEALDDVFRNVKPGARVGSAGTKWAPWWAFPLNIWLRFFFARKYVTTFEGFARRWAKLLEYVPDFRTERGPWGVVYVGWGTTVGPST